MDLNQIIRLINEFSFRTIAAADFNIEIFGIFLLPRESSDLKANCLYFGDIKEVMSLSPFQEPLSFLCYNNDIFPPELDTKSFKNVNVVVIENISQAQEAFNTIQNAFIQKTQFTNKMAVLLDASYADVGLQYIVNAASKVFSNAVFVVDTSFNYLASAGFTEDENLEMFQELKSGFISDHNVRRLLERRISESIRKKQGPDFMADDNNPGFGYLVDSVRIHNIEIANVVRYGKKEFFTDSDSELLHKFSKLISIELQKSNFYKQNKGLMSSYLLGEILDRGGTNIKNLRERLQLLGYSLKEYLCVIVIQSESKSIINEKLQLMIDLLIKLLPQCIHFIYNGSIVLLLSSSNMFDANTQVYSDLVDFLQENRLIAGMSNHFTQISEIKNYYNQALESIVTGTKIIKEPALHRYEDIKMYIIPRICLSQYSVEDLCHPGVLLLKEYDRKKHTSLFETLKAYLYYLKSPSMTSASLNMHRNTLLYDINKIKSMTGFSLEDGDEILNINFSIKVLEYFEKSTYLAF